MDGLDEQAKKTAIEKATRIEDQRSMQSYSIFKLMPDPSTGIKVPFLYLELSRQPVLLTVSPLLSALSQLQGRE